MSMDLRSLLVGTMLLPFVFAAGPVAAQEAETTTEVSAEAAAEAEDGLLTQAELENLVAPVALFPDTLLIQILVAATQPMEVVKSDRLLTVNEGEDPEVIKAAIEAEGYDESVEVLAVGFPEVIADMALHLEWTETIGNAMLAQSDDVMLAIQTMRTQAINTGALVSSEEQTVEVAEDETVVIQPADPEVVYVPQYDPQVVYDSNLVGDAVAAGLVAFATFTVIDAIFDDDDDWNDYWGCRNCAGWGGGPIYRNPDIDIDVDGNVNIGNDINIGNGQIGDWLPDGGDNIGDRLPEGGENIGDRLPEGGENIGDRLPEGGENIGDRRPGGGAGGWTPDEGRAQEARDKIAEKRGADGATTLPVNKRDSQGDALRSKLSGATGAADISKPGAKIDRDAVRKTMPGKAGSARDAVNAKRPDLAKPSKAVPKAPKKPKVQKPAAKPPVKKISKPKQMKKPKAISKKAPAGKARKASNRGKKAGGKLKGRR